MRHLLELFSGTGSIGRVFERHGWSVCSIDNVPSFNPTIFADILDVTKEQILFYGYPDCIWASPPCTEYSRARKMAKTPRSFEYADTLMRKAREVASWFPRTPFFYRESQQWAAQVARSRAAPPDARHRLLPGAVP
jgi:site-specific DNA-cytosine methylase